MQTPELRRQQQIRSRTVNQISQRSPVAPKNRNKIIRIRSKSANVTRKRIVLGKHAIQFKLRRELEFKLSPSARRIQPANAGIRIVGIPSVQTGASYASSHPANAAPAIKFTRQ